MAELLPQCQNLKEQVDTLIGLLGQEPSLAACDVTPNSNFVKKSNLPKV